MRKLFLLPFLALLFLNLVNGLYEPFIGVKPVPMQCDNKQYIPDNFKASGYFTTDNGNWYCLQNSASSDLNFTNANNITLTGSSGAFFYKTLMYDLQDNFDLSKSILTLFDCHTTQYNYIFFSGEDYNRGFGIVNSAINLTHGGLKNFLNYSQKPLSGSWCAATDFNLSQYFSTYYLDNVRYIYISTGEAAGTSTYRSIKFFNISDVRNIGNNSLPSFNVTYNSSTIYLVNGVATFNYTIDAYDPDGDTIYYAMQQAISSMVIDKFIDFDKAVPERQDEYDKMFDFFAPVGWLANAALDVGMFIGCDFLPRWLPWNMEGFSCPKGYKEGIMFESDMDHIETACTIAPEWGSRDYGIYPVYISVNDGWAMQTNATKCGSVNMIKVKPETENFGASIKIGLRDNTKVGLFQEGSTVDTIPIIFNKTSSGVSIEWFNETWGLFSSDSYSVTIFHWFNSSTYDVYIDDGDVNFSRPLYNRTGIPLNNNVIEAFGLYGYNGYYWFDSIGFFKQGYINTFETSYTSPLTFTRAGVFPLKFYVTDEYHLTDYSNFKEVDVYVTTGPGYQPKPAEMLDPAYNKVITNTPLSVFVIPFWGFYHGFGIDAYIGPWFWYIYLIALGCLIFIMKDLMIAFMSLNLLSFAAGVCGFIYQSDLLVILFLLALSLTPYAAKLFQVGNEK